MTATLTDTANAANTITMADIYAPINAYMDTVKLNIVNILPPESQLLAESLAHSLGKGGKLLRPALGLLTAEATGGITEAQLETAAVSEMIHTATLLHDDVLDDAELRRNKQTVRALWGNAVSILSGDYLLAQASRKLAQIGNIRVVAIFSDVLADLCDGEVEQIRTSYHLESLDWDSYYRKSICKTASLFAASCQAAGVLNGLPENEILQLHAYGKNLGVAFQVMDDLLDVTQTEEQLGKPAMDDLRNGLLTAPVLLALETAKETQPELAVAIQQIFDSKTPQAAINRQIADIKTWLHTLGAVDRTRTLARQFIEKAWAEIKFLPDSPAKTSLINMGQFVIQRTH